MASSESTRPGARQGGWRAMRWTVAVATGLLIARPGRLYYARLVATTGAASCLASLFDDASGAQDGPLLLALSAVAGAPDDWPRVPLSVPFLVGLDVTLSGAGAALLVAWDTD